MAPGLLRQRYEVKYLVHRRTLERLHRRLSQYMSPDPHGSGADKGYFVHSIYMDSPRYFNYLEKHEGLLSRLKPRIRTYLPHPGGPPLGLFLELKHRRDRIVSKERTPITADLAERLLKTTYMESDYELDGSPVLAKYYFLSRRRALAPRLSVLYHRRAFFCDFYPGLRITYDTRLQSSWATALSCPPAAFRYTLPATQLILEIKYTRKIPGIILREIENFELQQVTFSKYAASLEGNSAARSNVLRNYI